MTAKAAEGGLIGRIAQGAEPVSDHPCAGEMVPPTYRNAVVGDPCSTHWLIRPPVGQGSFFKRNLDSLFRLYVSKAPRGAPDRRLRYIVTKESGSGEAHASQRLVGSSSRV